jgi:hypothetical protein
MRRAPLASIAVFALASLAAPAARGQAPDEPYLRSPKKLTSDPRAGEAYFDPQGRRVLFQAVDGEHPYYQIYLMNVDGSGRRMVSTGKGKTTCSFFDPTDPDLFIYASTHLDERTWAPPPADQHGGYRWDYDHSFDVFLARLSTGEVVKRLTTADGYDAECAFSHDGQSICFTSRREPDRSDIWLMDRDGGHQRALVHVDGQADGGPFFSPDDRWVLFRASRGREDLMQVYLASVDGKETRQLTDQPRMNWAPYFHPDGQVVVYAANVGGQGNFDLFLVKADGSKREARLTTDGGFDGLPVFSPDGTKLMWTSTRGGGPPEVFIADFVMPPESAFVVPPPAPPPAAPPAATDEHDPHGHGQADPHAHPEHGSGQADPHAHPEQGSGQADPHAEHEGAQRGALVEPHALAAPAALPGAEQVHADALLHDIAWLADDAREGRRAGTPSEREAAAWLARRMAAVGLRPGGTDGRWLEPFTFSNGGRRADAGNALMIGDEAWTLDRDWRPLLYSASGDVDADVVFCGYGITSHDDGYDDLAGQDLQGKVALVLTGGPRSAHGGAFGKEHPTVWEDLMYKVGNLREAGAKAVLFVRSTPAAGGADDEWLRLDMGDPGVLVGQVSRARAAALGLDLDRTVAELDASGAPASRPLGRRARLAVRLERVRAGSQNVVGRLTGTTRPEEVIVVGAHYDHLGHGGDGSLAPNSTEVHNGADDNASGTAGLLALAAALRAAPPARTVLFVAFGAEEEGLLGSQALVARFPLDRARVVAMLNMDMIGRLHDQPLLVGGAGTAAEWPALIQRAADEAGLRLRTQQDGLGPSDHASFYTAGIPVLFLWTGTHADYHKPTDDVEKIDAPGEAKVVDVALALVRGIDGLDRRPTFTKVARGAEAPRRVVTGERGAYFGSVPNYTQEEVQGVLLDGAREGTPAARAGIQQGDIIVEFAGHEVRTIHDYVNALRMCRPGQEVTLVVLRGGQRVTLSATLEGR